MFFGWDANGLEEGLEIFRECFSKPQRNHFKTYVTGLVVGEKGEKNVDDIAANAINGKDQSSLNRFVTQPNWDVARLNAVRLRHFLPENNGGVLILDDTNLEKFGKCMEGAGYLYDSSQGTYILCHNIVSTFYTNGAVNVPMHFQFYIKDSVTDSLDVWFKTKIQLGIELLARSLLAVKPKVVVFDSWYFAKTLVDFLASRCLTWVTAADVNRCIQIDSEWTQLQEYFPKIPHTDFKRISVEVEENTYKWYYERVVAMKNVGLVKIVVLKRRKNGKGFKVLVSNDIAMSGSDVIRYYKARWNIEVFHRDCKQHLGMGEYQLRKLDAVGIHLHLVFLAYTLLKNAGRSPFFRKVLKGLETIGRACERLKRYVFEKLGEWYFRKGAKRANSIARGYAAV